MIDRVALLASRGGERQIQRELYEILAQARSEWKLTAAEPQEVIFVDEEVSWRILRRLSFDPDETGREADPLAISVSKKRSVRLHVPRCRACRRPLTREDRAAAVEVTGPTVDVACPAGHANQIALEDLFIWLRSGEAVCWKDRDEKFLSLEDPGASFFPPEFTVDRNSVSFYWPPSVLGIEDSDRRFLRLKFSQHRVREASLFGDALYRKLLVPGGVNAGFKGLPVRPEWHDAWLTHRAVKPEANTVWYESVRAAGIPFAFHLVFVPAAMDVEPGLAVAVYPKPMHAGWKPYRVFAAGAAANNVALRVPDGHERLAQVCDTEGWPGIVGVARQDGSSGVTWKTAGDWTAPPEQAATRPRVCLGIDFGTSNTVVYFQAKDRPEQLASSDNAVSLGDFERLVHWVSAVPERAPACSWLPEPPSVDQDRWLLPSALWAGPDAALQFIRWNAEPPQPGWQQLHGFKWDDGVESRRAQRIAYLRELLFHALPVVLERLSARRTSPALDIGFAYPLAFDYSKRRDFASLLGDLKSWLGASAGFAAETYTINESLASVRAAGAYNPNDLFLVADMGGRTLDIALFSYQADPVEQRNPRHLHQIGSIDFGGEIFVDALARRWGGAREESYWKLRDSITRGTAAAEHHQDATMATLLDRFQPMALEFLRVLLAAYCHADGNGRALRVLFVGNGWRLRELTAGGRDPAAVQREYFDNAVRQFEMSGVGLGETAIQGIANSKHWVACGALHAAKVDNSRELEHTEFPSRMPAGLSMAFAGQPLAWHELTGEGEGAWECADEAIVRTSPIDFDFESGPPPSQAWAAILGRIFRGTAARYPSAAVLRQSVLSKLYNRRLLKGPLALVVESHWKRLLCE